MKVQMGTDPTIRTVVKRTERGSRFPTWIPVIIFLGLCIVVPLTVILGGRISEALTDSDVRAFFYIFVFLLGILVCLLILMAVFKGLAVWNRLDDQADMKFMKFAAMISRGGHVLPQTNYRYNVQMPQYPMLPMDSRQQVPYYPTGPQVVYREDGEEIVID